MELLVETYEKGRFIVAVWAPRTTHGNNDDLAAKLRVRIRHHLSREIGEAESQGLIGIFDGCLMRRIRGSREVLLTSLGRPTGDQVGICGRVRVGKQALQEQGSIRLRGHRIECRTSRVEVAHDIAGAIPGSPK